MVRLGISISHSTCALFNDMYSTLSLFVLVVLATSEPDGYGTHSHHHHHFGGGPAGGFGIHQPVVPILVDNRQEPDAFGSYSFVYETADGVSRQEQGFPQGVTGAVAQQGGWSFTLPDGTPAAFNFIADENGFRVESDLLPTPPPLPAHAIAQIEKARLEDAVGASGNQGFFGSPSAPASQFSRPSSQYGAPPVSASQFLRPSNLFGSSSSLAPQFGTVSPPAPPFPRPSTEYGVPSPPAPPQSPRSSNRFGAGSSQSSQFSKPSALYGAPPASVPQFSRPSNPFSPASSQSSQFSKPSALYGAPPASIPQFSRPSNPFGFASASTSQFSRPSNLFGAASAPAQQFSRPSTQYGPPSQHFQG
ncbi:uncharacterized protein [Palaemon carinicauda]|uniref:uncharacterized protein n=1 Tax=Palaemon carinicauda TaxID=392227 RepID=UPI0035B698A5